MSVCSCGAVDDTTHVPDCPSLTVGCFCCRARSIVARTPLQPDAALLDNMEERGSLADLVDGVCVRHRSQVVAALVVAAKALL